MQCPCCAVDSCGHDCISPVLMVDIRHILEQMLCSVMIFGWCGYIQLYFRHLVVASLIHAAGHVAGDSCNCSALHFLCKQYTG